MRNNIFVTVTLLFVAFFTLVSCEKFSDEEDFESKEANSILIVRTRAAANDGTESGTESIISYPINIYVFDESNECVAVSTLSSADDELSLKLPEGMYEVCAVAGASADSYELPTQETATKETVLTLKDGQKHGDLMTANNTVTLEYGGTNTLTLALERKVMLIESVTINNVPASVSNVSVGIRPLKANLLLDGSYSGENGTSKIELTEDVDGSTWKNTDGVYLLEAVGRPTVEVTFTINGETVSYSYTCDRELKANHKVFITGTFTDDGIEMTGSISGVEWAEDEKIVFDFGGMESGETDDNGEEDGGETVSGQAPAVGSLYEDSYVLKSENTGDKTVVTLMSTTYKNALTYTKDDQESMKTAIDAGLKEIGAANVDGWRLPSKDELVYIGENIDVINTNLTSNGKEEFKLQSGTNNIYTFFFLTDDNQISTYNIVNQKEFPNPTSGKSSLYLCAFATVSFAN